MRKPRNPSRRGETEYVIGFGKPPRHTRFKPGQSGNPNGRPKGTRNFVTDLKATLSAPVTVTRGGRARKISTQKAALQRLRDKALGDDTRALLEFLKFAQTHSQDDEKPASLSADDHALLAIYRDLVLSGAAD